jgi:hypothetical protein
MGNCPTKTLLQNFEMTESDINNKNLQFTRYLYEKDEVRLTLLISVLNQKDESLFWAYELYYSGFITELIHLFIQMYYDFYAALHPSFQVYLQKNLPLLLDNDSENDKLLATIVHNFMIRSHTVDVFFMRILAQELQFTLPFITNYILTDNFTIIQNDIISLLEIEDYLTIGRIIFCELHVYHLHSILETFIDYYIDKKSLNLKKKEILQKFNKKVKTDTTFIRIKLFSLLIHFVYLDKKIKMGKNLYVRIEPEEVVMYETINVDLTQKGNGEKTQVLSAYKILPLSTLYFIDEDNYLSLFHLKRYTQDIKKAYQDNWLFHASFAPLWKQRIIDNNGIINYEKKTVEFHDEFIECFYEKYGYEPDEQKGEIQMKTIQHILHKRNWYDFYVQHKNSGIIDIDKMYLNDIKKITY